MAQASELRRESAGRAPVREREAGRGREAEIPSGGTGVRVHFSDRTGLTVGLRYRFTGPVRPVTGRNRTNANLNSNFLVEAIVTGILAG